MLRCLTLKAHGKAVGLIDLILKVSSAFKRLRSTVTGRRYDFTVTADTQIATNHCTQNAWLAGKHCAAHAYHSKLFSITNSLPPGLKIGFFTNRLISLPILPFKLYLTIVWPKWAAHKLLYQHT